MDLTPVPFVPAPEMVSVQNGRAHKVKPGENVMPSRHDWISRQERHSKQPGLYYRITYSMPFCDQNALEVGIWKVGGGRLILFLDTHERNTIYSFPFLDHSVNLMFHSQNKASIGVQYLDGKPVPVACVEIEYEQFPVPVTTTGTVTVYEKKDGKKVLVRKDIEEVKAQYAEYIGDADVFVVHLYHKYKCPWCRCGKIIEY